MRGGRNPFIFKGQNLQLFSHRYTFICPVINVYRYYIMDFKNPFPRKRAYNARFLRGEPPENLENERALNMEIRNIYNA